jgi:hypothetical protein
MFQVASVKLHWVSRCGVVSGKQKQSEHEGLQGQFFAAMLSVVRTISYMTSQLKKSAF